MATNKRPRLSMLRPTLTVLDTSTVRTLTGTPGALPRLRGKAGVERRERWLRLHPLCIDCQAEGRANALDLEVDHTIPLWKGGADDESNFATRCKDHHAAKTAREAAERGPGGAGPKSPGSRW